MEFQVLVDELLFLVQTMQISMIADIFPCHKLYLDNVGGSHHAGAHIGYLYIDFGLGACCLALVLPSQP